MISPTPDCILRDKFELKNTNEAREMTGTIWHAKCYPSCVDFMIRTASIAVLAVFSGSSLSHAQSNPAVDRSQQQSPATDPKAKPEPKGQPASLTGCVDEQEGKWVLVNDQTMAVIANLAADGFPTEAFAKHMGQRVTVRGTRSSDASRPVFKVRSIEMISETCAAR
jgi:hypothetical protein